MRPRRYMLALDGAVLDTLSGGRLGTVADLYPHACLPQQHRYLALDDANRPIAGPSKIRDLAALTVVREAGHACTLLDLAVA